MTSTALDLPLLVFDGDCGFCHRCVDVALRIAPVRAVAFQVADLEALGLTPSQVTEKVWCVTPEAKSSGAEAVAAVLMSSPSRLWRGCGRVLASRPVLALAERVYVVIARHRHRLPGGTAACRIG